MNTPATCSLSCEANNIIVIYTQLLFCVQTPLGQGLCFSHSFLLFPLLGEVMGHGQWVQSFEGSSDMFNLSPGARYL